MVLHDVMVHIDAVYLTRYGPWFARYAMQFTVAVRYVMSVWCHYACKDRGVWSSTIRNAPFGALEYHVLAIRVGIHAVYEQINTTDVMAIP